MVFLNIKNLSKKYSNHKVLDRIQFKIRKGEFVSILGPNGCGKTTLLNLISGLDKDYDGKIEFGEKNKLGYIFQNSDDSVLPWKNVMENVILNEKNLNENKICDILKEVELWKFRKHYAYQISGGMKQLLAISRAFIHNCNFLILDEPFSSLDYHMTLKVRNRLRKLYEKSRATILFVSHNIEDAILLSNKIIILDKDGKIKGLINVTLPSHRKDSLIVSKEFLKYKKKILNIIKNEPKR